MAANLSITIITLNEEENLQRCLKSLKGLNAEIVLVDSGSTDKTLSIAEKYAAKIYYRKFDNFANQKNWAVSKTTGDWILSIDADEEITEDLAEEINEAIKSDQFNGYLIDRRNFILGSEIRHSRWSPDLHIWLWRKNCGKWFGDVHEEVIVKGQVGLLKNPKLHRSHQDIGDFIKANDHYSTLQANFLFKEKTKFSLWRFFCDPLFEFFIRFIYKLGFLDGKRGFILAYLMGLYKLSVWIKIWELEQK